MHRSLGLGGAVDDDRSWSEDASCPATGAEPSREAAMRANSGCQGSNAENLALNLDTKSLWIFWKAADRLEDSSSSRENYLFSIFLTFCVCFLKPPIPRICYSSTSMAPILSSVCLFICFLWHYFSHPKSWFPSFNNKCPSSLIYMVLRHTALKICKV